MGFVSQKLTLIVLGAGCLLGLQNNASANDTDAYLGEIRMFAGNFAPRGWAFCDGQLLSIDRHQSLYAALGTNYGGDGRTTFGVPDLRGRFPMHAGQGPGLTKRKLGQKLGAENVTPTATTVNVTQQTDADSLPGVTVLETLRAQTNLPPFQVLNFIIAIDGVFPSRPDPGSNNAMNFKINPCLGEIRMLAGEFAPSGWAFCDGQLLTLDQNNSGLFITLNSIYASNDDNTTFGLPDFRGRIPQHYFARGEFARGAKLGTEKVTPTASTVVVKKQTADNKPEESVSIPVAMHAESNLPPSQAIHFIVALKGTLAKELKQSLAQPYLGEIRMLAGSDIPAGWMKCDGQLLSAREHSALHKLLGATYSENGSNSFFNLPDLRSRFPMHAGASPGLTQRVLGEKGGVENATSTATTVVVTKRPDDDSLPGVTVLETFVYQPNLPPSLAVTFIIATEGLYPSYNDN
ncbi:tail fiber protein [uncultured Gimesia sp.]|uniref:phage tail protein n=1 Tax=uncultured Gimesia sp. TaxID=1678688 RepID=UPI0030D846EF|tara:strand:+ start:12533 stop:13918 length:1386 start_codon:yes stop_codon:yes gene_type:complete